MQLESDYPRSSGVLLPVTMLHGPFGIGVLGAEAREFIDFLFKAGFHAWQVLPVEQTGVCFSPYKCISAFAGEPMLIDPRNLLEMGLINAAELSERAGGFSSDYVDYELAGEKQWALLRIAYSRLDGKPFLEYNPFWLNSYALYMAIKHHYDDKPWYLWPDKGLRSHDAKALKAIKGALSAEIGFYKFVQWIFNRQWRALCEYAIARGVSIIGDMPFYVSEDSAEVWCRRALFNADTEGHFLAVGGAPPDYFNPDGQNWGNPIYNWGMLKKENYKWWSQRVKASLERYDFVRFDHFRGFESYWLIPAGASSAREGQWANGPGLAIFKALEDALGCDRLPMIAEDLGDTHGDVDKLLRESGFRGMRVLQFGFLGDEIHLPHNLNKHCVAYTGTHDNTTLLAWMFELAPADRERALFYVGFEGDWTVGGPNCAINTAWIRMLFTSRASLVIVPIQDLLGYGADTRTNIPGTAEGNWRFRIQSDALGQIDAGFYAELNKATSRQERMTDY